MAWMEPPVRPISYKRHRFPVDVIRYAVWLYRAENSHLPIRRRERKQQKFQSRASAQRFLATHAAVYNTFYIQPHLISRRTLRKFRGEALHVWREATAS